MIFEGNRYTRKGFLHKNFVLNSILAEGVKPTLAELERFEETPEGLDIELATVDKEEIAHSFSNGDMVEVVEGELQNLQGKVGWLVVVVVRPLPGDRDRRAEDHDHAEARRPEGPAGVPEQRAEEILQTGAAPAGGRGVWCLVKSRGCQVAGDGGALVKWW